MHTTARWTPGRWPSALIASSTSGTTRPARRARAAAHAATPHREDILCVDDIRLELVDHGAVRDLEIVHAGSNPPPVGSDPTPGDETVPASPQPLGRAVHPVPHH